MMSLTITAITTDATEPVHTHLRNLPTGTVAIFAPRNTQPITLAKHVDDTWRGYAGDHLHTHRVGPWVSDSGLTITSSDLAAQIRRQWEGNNAYYTAITPTAMNTLSQ